MVFNIMLMGKKQKNNYQEKQKKWGVDDSLMNILDHKFGISFWTSAPLMHIVLHVYWEFPTNHFYQNFDHNVYMWKWRELSDLLLDIPVFSVNRKNMNLCFFK